MFPKTGKPFPSGGDGESNETTYAAMIAAALRSELGSTHRATKTVMRWTGASERTAKHWLGGVHGPSGEHLIVLMRESEIVLDAVLTVTGRRDVVVAGRVLEAYGAMVEVMALFESELSAQRRSRAKRTSENVGESTPVLGDPENDRIDDRIRRPLGESLNPRQLWYLEALEAGKDIRAADLQRRWRVSEKTARRDISMLKALNLIRFVGTTRSGGYRLR